MLKPMGGDSLNMSIWKRDMFAKGNIYSNETQKPLTGVTAKLFDLTNNKVDSVVLADQSQYSFLMRPDRKYKIEFTKKGYRKEELTLNTDGLLQGEVINDIVMHEESIESAIVYFDYDKSEIKEEAFTQMALLIRTLKNYPAATVNIGAHADSRGGFDYNQRLSNDRANSVVKYLTENGISRKRITARGFGEKLLLNRCTDTVNCEEVEHSLNRRAEIKVQLKDELKTNTGVKQKK
jgi:outer membrane protein OmpA-like peptidoglycan-associated protein